MGELAAGLTQKTWMDGETIAEMGQPVASMFFIMQGEVGRADPFRLRPWLRDIRVRLHPKCVYRSCSVIVTYTVQNQTVCR